MTLLAKHSWRILQGKCTLLHKIYKAKYFPKVQFFDAPLDANPSYAWRGIWEAKHLLRKGGRWSIGNGKAVRIWKDCWVPGHQVLQRDTVCAESDTIEAKVGDLIDGNTKWWDVNRIRALFNPNLAVEILKTVPSPSDEVNRWIWDKKKGGRFSVKSAYRVFKASKGEIHGEPSNASLHIHYGLPYGS
ncbi:hypothetical protein I3842_09G152300 [Carya illinoinensis]|uniref:Uncharacterized protein n=1 Tax=Carya illinoinensis TaxID=32201 RepID=A0A922E6Q5_CARIL|nr:hypothetical protein I3842_09G152300 [Carya illinoinensis]